MAMIPPEPSPALRLTIDEAGLAGNWLTLARLSGGAATGAAIKADAYGVGVSQAVPILRDAGCRDFFVAHWCEVAPVLGLIPQEWLSVLHGPLTDADAAFARVAGVKPVINSIAQARRWIQSGGGRCDLMVDTGINRLGLPLAELGDETVAQLDIDTLMSHLASADEDVALNELQLQRWREARVAVPHRRASLANSAGIALGADYHGDLTRPGLALYGGVPRRELAGRIVQVARPQAMIMQIRNLATGDSVGYNATYIAQKPLRVGVIALGYADGYLRCWSSRGRMVHGDAILPVLGRVSMDMTVVDLSEAPYLQEGDWIEAAYSLPDAAAATGLSQYELLTLLADRFAR